MGLCLCANVLCLREQLYLLTEREKKAAGMLKIIHNLPGEGGQATPVLRAAENGCGPVWLLQLEFILPNLRHYLASN